MATNAYIKSFQIALADVSPAPTEFVIKDGECFKSFAVHATGLEEGIKVGLEVALNGSDFYELEAATAGADGVAFFQTYLQGYSKGARITVAADTIAGAITVNMSENVFYTGYATRM